MRGDLTVRKTQTASGATAIQVVRYEGKRCIVVKHIGSAHDEQTCIALSEVADRYVADNCLQPSLLIDRTTQPLVPVAHTKLIRVTHLFARNTLFRYASLCGLEALPELYLDLALMRIIEPASKLRTIALIEQYFNIQYAERTVYRWLPKLLDHQETIEQAAINTALNKLKESFSLVLYDVTTLYFESFKEYDFQKPGFSKDNKPQQPQIVIGLLTTRNGFPVMHEVFEGNTFEGNTMLSVVHRFQQRFGETKPVIVADAAMLSLDNMKQLEAEGYHYIVGARLANTTAAFIETIHTQLPRHDKANKRLSYARKDRDVYTIVCEYSESRFKKDKREFQKQIERARSLVQRNEPGRRAKFVKKSQEKGRLYSFDDALQTRTEKLLGVKGYVTNMPEEELSNIEIISYYRDLWHVEQAFPMSKSDLRARPIFLRKEESIRAHILICFISLMIGKFLEIKTELSLKKVRDALWKIHEAHVMNELSGEVHILNMDLDQKANKVLTKILENTH